MPYSNFPNGITSMGVPTVGMGPFIPTGNVFFVSSVTGSNGNAGVSPSATQPLATITFALSLCTANNGDVIYCLPGHAETITGAAGIALSVAGVTIIGLGSGFQKPTITFTTAITAQMTVTGANTVISNFNFISNFAAITALISVTAAGVQFQGCNFYTAVAGTVPLISILTTTAADDLLVNGCNFYYLQSLASTAGTPAATEVIRLDTTDRIQITNSYFGCNCSTAAINNTAVAKEIQILNCVVVNPNVVVTGFAVFAATSTGNIQNVTGYTGAGTGNTGTIITTTPQSGMAITNCYATTNVALKQSGVFLGVVST